MIAGVCGGIAEYLEIDPTVVRAMYVLVSLFTGGVPGLIGYIILVFVMPKMPLLPPSTPMPSA